MLYMRILRHRKVKLFALGHTVISSDPEIKLLSYTKEDQRYIRKKILWL